MILKNHWVSKEAKRNHQVKLVKDLIIMKKTWAIKKMHKLYLNKQEYLENMTLAEVFNRQYMFQQSFRAWVKYFTQNQVNIRKGAHIKLNSVIYRKKQFLNLWL